MDDTQSSYMDSWMMARLGNAIDAGIDRVVNRPQYIADPAQAYGVDQNGQIYQLGQVNGQLSATIQTATPKASSISPLLILIVLAVVALEAK